MPDSLTPSRELTEQEKMSEAYDRSSMRIADLQRVLRESPFLTDQKRDEIKRAINYEMAVWN